MQLNKEVLQFLITKRLCVVSIANDNGNPFSAVVFYAFEENPLAFYFLTDKKTKKVDGLVTGTTHRASIVIGFTENEWYTFQAEGSITIVDEQEKKTTAEAVYYLKFPGAQKIEKDPNLVFLKFIPVHWKFTDLNPTVWKILTSES